MDYSVERFTAVTAVSGYLERYVNVAHFLTFCEKCPNYGNVWSCPPYDFDPRDIWRAYDTLTVFGCRITYSGERTASEMENVLFEVKRQLTEELEDLAAHRPGSLPLSAGSCRLCEKCARPEGLPCRHPDKMRYSVESLGGDVGKTISELCGIDIEWIEGDKLPDHLVLVAGLLEKVN